MDDCIISPLTGRAVKINSPAGRRALKYNSKNNLKASNDCVINPLTGRAVKKDGALGKKILKGLITAPKPAPKPAKVKNEIVPIKGEKDWIQRKKNLQKNDVKIHIKILLRIINEYLEIYYKDNKITTQNEKDIIRAKIFKNIDFSIYDNFYVNDKGDITYDDDDKNMIKKIVSYVWNDLRKEVEGSERGEKITKLILIKKST